jgi:hypothetical protein
VNNVTGPIKDGEFFTSSANCWLLKKEAIPWNESVKRIITEDIKMMMIIQFNQFFMYLHAELNSQCAIIESTENNSSSNTTNTRTKKKRKENRSLKIVDI